MKYTMAGVQTERLRFRAISRSDFDAWLEFHKDPKTHEHWIAESEAPETECEKWYRKQFFRYENGLGGMNALIEKRTGLFIGHCGLLVQTVDHITELEIAYSLLPGSRNNGFATEAAKKCRDVAFEHAFAPSLISIISVTNTPSEKVALKNGMTLDKTTEYKGNKVNIFRICREEWKR